MNITSKPIRKCNGCGLNARSHCGVYDIPRLMWGKGNCPGYKNEELLMKYKEARALMLESKDEARRKRQEVQALRKTENHHSGNQHRLFSCDAPPDVKRSAALRANFVSSGMGTRTVARATAVRDRRRMRLKNFRTR